MNTLETPASVRTFFRLLRYTFRYRFRLVLAIVCTLVVSVLEVFSLTMLLPIVETIFNRTDQPSPLHNLVLLSTVYDVIGRYAQNRPMLTLGIVSICFILLVAITGVFRYAQAYFVNWIGNRVILDLQHQLFARMSRFHAAYFAAHRVGSLVSYFTVDIRVIGLALFNVLGRLLLDPCLLLVSVIFLLYLNWKLTLLYALVVPFIIWTIQYYARKNRQAGRRAQDIMARLGAFLQEHFTHIRLVQGYGMYRLQDERFHEETRGVYNASMSMVRARAASSPINEFLGVFACCGVLILGGYFIFHDQQLNANEFVIFIACLGKIYQPLKRMEKSIQEVQHGIAAADRVFFALDEDATLPCHPQARTVSAFEREIRFDRVGFSYDRQEMVLRDLSFAARKGEILALVGPSGVGKTTLVNLIPRFYDPSLGAIFLDDQDLRHLDVDALRRLISFVPQDVLIFADSVRSNLTCGESHYSDEAVLAAARDANAHDFIEKLPNGYDTILGDRGIGLSGGQCQRLAIARAFLRNSPILILDEATSSLDSTSELHIKQSLERLMQGRTAFVIAHRLSTVLSADRILVMDGGRIIDSGPHQELLQRCPLYRKLYQLQFAVNGNAAPVETFESVQ